MEIAEKLARYVNSFEFRKLSSGTVSEAKRHFIDSMGCMFGSLKEPTIQKLRKSLNYNNLMNKTFIIGAGIRYLDFNDTYLAKEPAHPSDNISALLSLAVEKNCNGKDLISAIALAYEIQCRLCDAGSLRKQGWDHVAYIPISAACGASKLLGLNLEKIRNAIALAATSGASLRQTRVGMLSEWKGLTAGNSAQSGLWAALLARAGISGPSEIFEGKHGFLNQVLRKDFDKNFYNFLDEKPAPKKISETYIKFHPVEYHIQAVAEAVLNLRKEHSWAGKTGNIDKITVITYEAAASIVGGDKSKWDPHTRETADHSIPYIVAAALINGKIWLDQFTEQKIKDKKLKPLMNKVEIVENPVFTQMYGKAFPAMIEIKSNSGKIICKRVDFPKGHPGNPMNNTEIEKKFYKLFKIGLKNEYPAATIKWLCDNTLKKYWNMENEIINDALLEYWRMLES